MKTTSGASLMLAGLSAFLTVPISWASEEIASEQGLECQLCHGDQGTGFLTDQGRYFQYMGSLDGFDQVTEQFGSCLYCHVQEADSIKLTREGQRFYWMMEDMQGLKAWLEENHPSPEAEVDDSDN
jgi:hypothetical protein